MRPSTKIFFGSCLIVTSIALQILSMFGVLKPLGKLIGKDFETSFFFLQFFVGPIVSLIGFIFTLVGMYQAAKLAEKAIFLTDSMPQPQSPSPHGAAD